MDLRAGRRVSRRAGRRGDRGAAAVEFALLALPLFTVLFGAVTYGLYFADVLTVERATADAARNATLSASNTGLHWTGATTCLPSLGVPNELAKVVCNVSSSVQPLNAGTVYVKAQIVGGSGILDSWQSGNQLRVCTATRENSFLPFVPLPNAGLITSRVDMPIQPGGPASVTLSAVQMDISSIGADWSWC